MAEREDLEKLFDAALHGKKAPSRFGTPEEQMKSVPAAFRRPAPAAAGKVNAAGDASEPSEREESAPDAKPTPAVRRDKLAEASLDNTVNAELAAIMDEKVARDRRRRRRSLVITLLLLLGVAGGGIGWVVSNPHRYEALKMAMAEIKSVGDVKGMAAKYQKALDKVAVRGRQIDDAAAAMGVDPRSVDEHADSSIDESMKEMMGEGGGKTTAERDKLLGEKFNSVKESGSLLPKEDGGKNAGATPTAE